MVYLGFGASLVAHGIVLLALSTSYTPDWVFAYNPYHLGNAVAQQKAFETIFGLNWNCRFKFTNGYGALIAGRQLVWFLKEVTKNKHLWLRNGGSTLISQLTDTLIVNVLLLYCGLKLELNLVIQISLALLPFKMGFAICNIPLFYAAVAAAK